MKPMKKYYLLSEKLKQWEDIPLLLVRLTLAYGFYGPAMMKLKNVQGIADWFASMHYIFPKLNAYLATITETSGVILLTLGFLTRFISIPLIITMLVAIFTVHLSHGFQAGNNGFEIPFYYIIMLLVLVFSGPGKFSLDYLISKKMGD